MSQTNTDILYIEDDYFTPDGYYTYTALAVSSQSSAFTLSATISHIEGADIVANNFASVSATANIINGVNSSLSSSVTQTTTANRIRESLTPYAYTWADVVEWDRFPGGSWLYNGTYVVANISLSADLTEIVGQVVEASGSWSSAFTQTTSNDKLVSGDSTQSSAFTQSSQINYLAEGASTQSSQFTQTATGLRVIDFAVALSGAFSPVMDVSAIRNSFAVLDSQTSMSVDAVANRATSIALTSAINQSLSGDRFRDYASSQLAEFTQSSQAVKTASASSAQSCAFTLTAQATEIQDGASIQAGTFSLSAIASRPTRLPLVTTTTTPRYTDIGFSTSTKKFGSASFYATSTNGTAEIRPRSNAVWDGTNFKTFADGYTWTSSDGITWSRATNNLSIGNFYPTVKYLNSNWIFVSGGLIYYSNNGTTWSTQNPGVGGGYTFENINYYSGYFYISGGAIGSGRFVIYRSTTITGTYSLAYQTGAITDYNKSSDIILNGSGLAVAYSRYNGSSYSNYLVYGSATTWTLGTIETGATNSVNLLAHDGTTYAVSFSAESTTIKKSTNGSSWSNSSASVNLTPKDIAYKNSKWIVTTRNTIYAGTTIDNVASVLSNNFVSDFYDNVSAIEFGASKWLYIKNGSALYSTNTISWIEDDIEDVVNMPGYVDISLGDNTDYSQFGTMDFWINNPGSGYSRILSKFNPNGANGYFAVLNSNTFEFSIINGLSLFGSVSTGWNHIRISSSSGTMSLYINGTRAATGSGSLTSTTGQLRFFGQPSTGTVYIDEFLITDEVLTSPSATTITTPTGEFANTATTDLLLHFNGNFEDSSEIPKVLTLSAALSSTATQTASAVIQAQASADISTSASQSASAVRLRDVAATLASEFALAVSGEELAEEGTATLSSEFTQSADANRIRNVSAELASAFTQSAQVLRIQQGAISTDAVFSELAAVAKIGDFLITLESQAQLTADANRTRAVAATLTAQSSLSADVVVVKEYASAQTSTATQTVQALRIQDSGELAFEAFGAELAVVYVIASFFVNANVAATLTANARVTTGNIIDANSQFALTAQTDVTKQFGSAQNSTATLSADGIKAVEAQAALASAFNLTAQPVATLSFITTEPVVASQITQANYTALGQAQITSALQFGLSLIDVTRTVEAQLTANSSVNIVNQRVRYMDAQIASEFSLANSLQQIKRTNADLTASCTLLATISHIEGADLQAFANSTVSTQANVFRGVTVAATSTATITTLPTKLVITGATLTSQAQVMANAGKQVVGAANLTSAFSPVMTFSIIHIDPYLTWKIQADNRLYKIQREDRDFGIREETRQFIIKG